MKREEIRAIFADATDEQVNRIMEINGADVENVRAKLTVAQTELNNSKEAYKTLNTELEALKTANANGEEWKAKFETLQRENLEKEQKAEADRLLAEKTADIERRFTACVGDKKFTHEAIKADYLRKFTEALDNADNKGKGDKDIFHALTKDDSGAFVGVTAVKLDGGKPQSLSGKYKSREEILAIKDGQTRRNEMLANSQLFPELA